MSVIAFGFCRMMLTATTTKPTAAMARPMERELDDMIKFFLCDCSSSKEGNKEKPMRCPSWRVLKDLKRGVANNGVIIRFLVVC